jgi:hypothetical protein
VGLCGYKRGSWCVSSHIHYGSNHLVLVVATTKVAVVRESHKLFLSLTGEFA